MSANRETIIEKLRELMLSTERFDKKTVQNADEKTELFSQLGLTSFEILYVMVLIEEKFKIMFDDINYTDFFTVGDLIDYIEKKL